MADIKIIKLKVRRGSDAQRKSVILDQGELGYTIDTKRLYVGNGVLSGGVSIATKVHPILTNFYSLSNTISELGDLVVANNLFYQLTATDYTNVNSWAYIGPKLDPINFEFNASNEITIKNASISASKLNPASVLGGLKIDSGNLVVDYYSNNFEISGTRIQIKTGGVTEREIATSTLVNGITGGNGDKIGLNVDPAFFYFGPGNRLSISAVPATSLQFASLQSVWFGAGLNYDLGNELITTTVTNVDGSTIVIDGTTGIISLDNQVADATTREMSRIENDVYGRVVSNTSSIFDVLTGNSTLNSNNSLSSIFNGNPIHSLSGAISGIPLTIFQAISSLNGVTSTIQLTSAGFIVFNGNEETRSDGKLVGKFAIPIFAVP